MSGALETWSPHRVCAYLYELATTFTAFYEHCPVLKAPSDAVKNSRLLLCHYVSEVLRIGLHDLLGIDVMDEM